ncbi:putative splicing factor U2AF 23 kDa subunit, partial [Piptocephalis cylindrospora]
MAEHLASIYGTEKDKVNCSFYFKIGACRHGDRCSRKHVKPAYSTTILMPNLFLDPDTVPTLQVGKDQLQEHFELFYEDIYIELCKYGELEEMIVCENVGDHLVGNVYARYAFEEEAGNACEAINQRFYAGRPIYAELSPVTDFRESCCRQHEVGECTRGGFCNFMHVRRPSRELERSLRSAMKSYLREKGQDE